MGTPPKNILPQYAFELGREWKISLAEIEAIFGFESIISLNPKIAIIQTDAPVAEIANRMGGVIRAFEIISELRDSKMFPHRVTEEIEKIGGTERITFGLGSIGIKMVLFSHGLRLKKDLRDRANLNIRLVNKDDENLVSALVKREGLVGSGTEFFLIECDKKYYFSRTIFIQDIDAYSARDIGKSRDMEVGMLPPKLAQTMINIALGSEDPGVEQIGLFDPFCGLGTVLIEAANMGIVGVCASDLSPEMVEATSVNLIQFYQKSDTLSGSLASEREAPHVEIRDAKTIAESPYISDVTHIVTEGYLGRIFGQHSIRPELVEVEKQKLLEIYSSMFTGLREKNWNGTIVMTIPCWEIKDSTMYFGEFYAMIERAGFRAIPLLADRADVRLTKFGSLIYRRPGQTVGREVVKIMKK